MAFFYLLQLLKKLKFEKTWKFLDIETSVVQFLPKFQQLEVLEIANTTVRDNSLEVFGTYFKHLRYKVSPEIFFVQLFM